MTSQVRFPRLRALLPVIATGPLQLRDAITWALAWADGAAPREPPTADTIRVLREHVGGWFGPSPEVRALLGLLGADVMDAAESDQAEIDADAAALGLSVVWAHERVPVGPDLRGAPYPSPGCMASADVYRDEVLVAEVESCDPDPWVARRHVRVMVEAVVRDVAEGGW